MQRATHHHRDAQGLASRFATRLQGEQQLVAAHVGPHSTPVGFGFGHTLTYHHIAVAGEDGGISHIWLVVKLQRSTSSVLSPAFLQQAASPSIEPHCAREVFAIGLVGLESHPCPCAQDYHPTLGIEVHHRRRFLHFGTEIAHVGPLCHIVAIDTRSDGFVVEGENAAVELLVVAVELLCHLLVEEPLLGRPSVRVLIFAPVQLPTGVGSQFIEAAVERIGQDEGTCSLTVLQLHQTTLQHVAFLVPEFGIEQLAQVRQLPGVAPAHVDLEVKRIAGKVAGIVQVQEDLLLRDVTTEEFQVLLPTLQRRWQSRGFLCPLEDVGEVPLQAVTLCESRQQTSACA